MQNIIEICKEFGFEIPTDKQAEFNKRVSENYLTKAEHDKKLGKAESERDSWKEKAETAETTLKSFEGIDPANIQKELADWKRKAEEAEKNAQKQIYERDFADALKEEIGAYKFSSESARRSVMRDIEEAGLKLKDGKILGLSDLIEQIKKNDASAFVTEGEEDKPRFTTVTKQNSKAMSKEEIMKISDPHERQTRIAENIHLFRKV